MHWRDDDHRIEISMDSSADSMLLAKSGDGRTLYEGLLPSDEAIDVLPEPLRDKVRTLVDLSAEASAKVQVHDGQIRPRPAQDRHP